MYVKYLFINVMNGKLGWKLFCFGFKVYFIFLLCLSLIIMELIMVFFVEGLLILVMIFILFLYIIVFDFNGVDLVNFLVICKKYFNFVLFGLYLKNYKFKNLWKNYYYK